MEPIDTQMESTPMKKVWKIVGATMLGTLLIGYALHGMSMMTLRAQNAREREATQENISKLTEYRDQLAASTSTSSTEE